MRKSSRVQGLWLPYTRHFRVALKPTAAIHPTPRDPTGSGFFSSYLARTKPALQGSGFGVQGLYKV